MVLPYDFNARRLAMSGQNPQLDDGGMIEFQINDLVPGGREVLMLALSSFDLPSPRSVPPQTINYLKGSVNVPGRPSAITTFSCEFVDYIDGRQRDILHQWFDKVYNERTGLGLLPSDLKRDAYAVLFGPDGVERASYIISGVWPTSDPPPPRINYDGGNIVKITMNFSCDWIEEEFIGGGAVVGTVNSAAGKLLGTS
jgi:hypothetical protein